jgi:hypothetical protein
MMAGRFTRRPVWATAAASLLLIALGGCAGTAQPNQRVTGDCHALLLHCSSRQTTEDLDDSQRAALQKLQERSYPDVPASQVLTASATALRGLGFSVLTTDPRTGLVHAELDQVLASQARRRARAFVKLLAGATGLPIRGSHLQGPDHESVRAMALVRVDPGTRATLLHVEFEQTVVDSKGNSTTTTPTEPKRYTDFFEALDLGRQRPAQQF